MSRANRAWNDSRDAARDMAMLSDDECTDLCGAPRPAAAQGAEGRATRQVVYVSRRTGGSIRGALQRSSPQAPAHATPFFFVGLEKHCLNEQAYLLGLGQGDPHHIVLRKGALCEGLPNAPTGRGVLRCSAASFQPGTWLHLRLDVEVGPSGDVLLQVFQNDLCAHPLGTAPSWTAIPGMALFVDDARTVNTGSRPLTSGRVGFGFFGRGASRRALCRVR